MAQRAGSRESGHGRRLVHRAGRVRPGVLAGALTLLLAPAAASAQERDADGPRTLSPLLHGPAEDRTSRDVFEAAMEHLGADETWRVRHAAMIEVESAWRADAASAWAQGLTQFSPPTRSDVWPRIAGCAGADPFDPWCGVLAMDYYMRALHARAVRLEPDRRAALDIARRSYNGGFGWQQREVRLCRSTPGCDPRRADHMAALCREAGRSEAACRENHGYGPKIARAEPKYRRRGLGRRILRGVAIGASVAQGRVPDLR